MRASKAGRPIRSAFCWFTLEKSSPISSRAVLLLLLLCRRRRPLRECRRRARFGACFARPPEGVASAQSQREGTASLIQIAQRPRGTSPAPRVWSSVTAGGGRGARAGQSGKNERANRRPLFACRFKGFAARQVLKSGRTKRGELAPRNQHRKCSTFLQKRKLCCCRCRRRPEAENHHLAARAPPQATRPRELIFSGTFSNGFCWFVRSQR